MEPRRLWLAVCVTAGFAVFASMSRVASQDQSKKDDSKKENQGTLTLGEKTYKFASALAYETTISKKKRTVVILSEKPLNTAKLKESFKKNGNDQDFFSFDPNVKLLFDEKQAFLQLVIFADGANINLVGDDNIKATATFKDGTAKGKAGTVKPGKSFNSTYQFEVTFDVKLMKP